VINAVTSSHPTPPAAKATPSTQAAAQPKPQTIATGSDTAHLSSAGQAALQAAVKEASETPAQTAQEARIGDVQAKRLLAKEAASRISK
jgi:hypothetical protein